jgi:DNA oxidative demethylase
VKMRVFCAELVKMNAIWAVKPDVTLRGVPVYKGLLKPAAQKSLVMALRNVVQAAPLYTPVVASGKAMSVRMTSAGRFGWFSDRSGYRYLAEHPSGTPWPGIPPQLLKLWRQLTGLTREPDCCLINFYSEGAKMGLHQDRDEADFSWPVLSLSLGDDGLFRVGNTSRGGKTESLWLSSGDVVLLQGDKRLVWHGVDRIRYQSSGLLPAGGRINVTLRVVA